MVVINVHGYIETLTVLIWNAIPQENALLQGITTAFIKTLIRQGVICCPASTSFKITIGVDNQFDKVPSVLGVSVQLSSS